MESLVRMILDAQLNALSVVVSVAFCLLLFVMFAHRDKLDCIDLITSPDGRLSRTAIGQVAGTLVAIWTPVYLSVKGNVDSVTLGICLAYLGGVEAYAKYLRWKSDQMKGGQ